ncbi:MAG: 50S ribosomal protein L23 [Burkholderiales bacterium]|jgi:large subunit ribosomal protein L23
MSQVKFNKSRLTQVLLSPIVTEKATFIAEKNNQVLFKVLPDATKHEIKAAVESLFSVEVLSVQTLVQKGKVKRFARAIGRRNHVKKAFIVLKEGQELKIGEGS